MSAPSSQQTRPHQVLDASLVGTGEGPPQHRHPGSPTQGLNWPGEQVSYQGCHGAPYSADTGAWGVARSGLQQSLLASVFNGAPRTAGMPPSADTGVIAPRPAITPLRCTLLVKW